MDPADLFRRAGLAATVQRRAVLAALQGRRDHPTAEAVYGTVRMALPGLSRTTVYRILETFARRGFVAKVCHPGGSVRFDPITRRHHHLVCVRCDRIWDLEDPALDRLAPSRRRWGGFVASDCSVYVRGICRACRREAV